MVTCLIYPCSPLSLTSLSDYQCVLNIHNVVHLQKRLYRLRNRLSLWLSRFSDKLLKVIIQ